MRTQLCLAALLALATTTLAAPPALFVLPRTQPWRFADGAPSNAAPGRATFTGKAQPGEFYVFQVGLVARDATGPLRASASDLAGSGKAIPSSAIRCLSLGGIGPSGESFTKALSVPAGGVQVLWFGIAVPPAAASGDYRGRLTLADPTTPLGEVDVALTVAGEPLADGGDSHAGNLSRLRWLDSTVGVAPTVTRPYVPVKTRGRTVQVLGRELELGADGLPAQVRSTFNAANTAIGRDARLLLARPWDFVVETADGPVRWTPHFGDLARSDLGAQWQARLTADACAATVTGRLDYTGSGSLRIVLTATRDLDVSDIRLVVPWRTDTATYLMGLNRPGGRRPDKPVQWTWDVAQRHQDCFWLGDVNAGLCLRFKGDNYVRPLVNIYYKFLPLNLPDSWGNGGRGGIVIPAATNGVVEARAFSGPRRLRGGERLAFTTDFYLTPFRPLDTAKQWSVRFLHPNASRDPATLERAIAQLDPAHGPNVLNVHQAHAAAPYINYPYSDDTFPLLRSLAQRAHATGAALRVYYTTREITQNMPELFALHSLNGEVIFPGPGARASTLIHPKGPHPWLVANLVTNFVPAWVDRVQTARAEWDLSVITRPDSRWNNFYLEGLQWMVAQADLDGIYVDDTALDARSLQRARRILDTRPGRLIDLHSWNHFNGYAGFANNLAMYMELLPYLDRLWLGEGFSASHASRDFWLVEMSGLPFGLMSEMLDGVNAWRGLVFGETARMGWSGDPRAIWKAWDEWGLRDTAFIPFYDPRSPVKTDRDTVSATVYQGRNRTLVAVASWAPETCQVQLAIDWRALKLDPAKASVYAPPIAGFQTEAAWKPGAALPVEPGRGWLLVLDETPRQVLTTADTAATLVEVFRDGFAAPALEPGWRLVRSAAAPAMEVAPRANALVFSAPANRHGGLERDLPAGVRSVEAQLDGGTDGGQTWGPGLALTWRNGRTVKINLRLEDKKFGTLAGDGLRFSGGPLSRSQPETVRILLGEHDVLFQRRAGDAWLTVDRQSRAGLDGAPATLRVGKLAEDGRWQDFGGDAGAVGNSAIRTVIIFAAGPKTR